FEGARFTAAIECPHRRVFGFSCAVQCDVAEQVFEATVLNEWVRFEIQEDVSGGWFGKPRQATAVLLREQLVNRCVPCPKFKLKTCLFAYLDVTIRSAPFRFLLQWQRQFRETCESRYIPFAQFSDLQLRDSGDE